MGKDDPARKSSRADASHTQFIFRPLLHGMRREDCTTVGCGLPGAW